MNLSGLVGKRSARRRLNYCDACKTTLPPVVISPAPSTGNSVNTKSWEPNDMLKLLPLDEKPAPDPLTGAADTASFCATRIAVCAASRDTSWAACFAAALAACLASDFAAAFAADFAATAAPACAASLAVSREADFAAALAAPATSAVRNESMDAGILRLAFRRSCACDTRLNPSTATAVAVKAVKLRNPDTRVTIILS